MLQAFISSALIALGAVIVGCFAGNIATTNSFKEAIEATKELKWKILAVYIFNALFLFLVAVL